MSHASMISKIQTLGAAINDKPPYVSGACPIPPDEFTLFYGRDHTLGRIDLSKAGESHLRHLAQACQPATFGVNQKDILDESYRKAGKIDAIDFAPRFNLENSGLLDLIHTELLEGHDDNKEVEAELYKLNVYGKYSFFKSHKDTPRGERMFGSLVIVFPTPHDGGALILRHGGKEWTFDSANVVAEQSQPSIGFIAFYSDVEHEVALVKTGYRVTLTYNLYFAVDEPTRPLGSVSSPNELAFRAAFSTLLDDPEFMPEGGYIGFGLLHQYPIEDTLVHLINNLKGTDAVISRTCTKLSLAASLKILYETDDGDDESEFVMVDRVVDLSNRGEIDQSIWDLLQDDYDGTPVRSGGKPGSDRKTPNAGAAKIVDVWWVTKATAINPVQSQYLAFGNEASLAGLYGDCCLIVKVGKSEQRATA